MATLAALASVTLTLDYDDTLTTDGEATFVITPTTGSRGEGVLTGRQVLGPYKQAVSIVLTARTIVTYTQTSDTSVDPHALYSIDPLTGVIYFVLPDGSLQPAKSTGFTAAIDAQSGIDINRLDPLRPDSITVSATGMYKGGAGYLLGAKVLSATGLAVAFSDQATPVAQRAIATYTGLAAGDEIVMPGNGYPLINGLYATFTGTGVLSVRVA